MRCTASNSSDRRDTAPSGVPLTAPAANLSYIRDEFLQEPAPAMLGLSLGSFPGAMARNVLPTYASWRVSLSRRLCPVRNSGSGPPWPWPCRPRVGRATAAGHIAEFSSLNRHGRPWPHFEFVAVCKAGRAAHSGVYGFSPDPQPYEFVRIFLADGI